MSPRGPTIHADSDLRPPKINQLPFSDAVEKAVAAEEDPAATHRRGSVEDAGIGLDSIMGELSKLRFGFDDVSAILTTDVVDPIGRENAGGIHTPRSGLQTLLVSYFTGVRIE